MTYYNDKLSLISDSFNNIDLFRLLDDKIIRDHFDSRTQIHNETTITTKISSEYDVSIDEDDTIYLIYQNDDLDLILTLIEGEEIEKFKLTNESIPKIYYLNIITENKNPHIFYVILLSEKEKKYRIYHHYLDKKDWITTVVDEINVREVLNPMNTFETKKKIFLTYYDGIKNDQIYMKAFNLEKKKWEKKIRLTDDEEDKLYSDIIYKDNKIHLTYCQYAEDNLVVKYERFDYKDDYVEKEIEKKISNPENSQYPTFIYYEDKLWIVWIEYENVMSSYSDTFGDVWSPIYLWNESKKNDIVRYKYNKAKREYNTVLNYSFGKFSPEIGFIGFGPIEKTTEVPLKKKKRFPRL